LKKQQLALIKDIKTKLADHGDGRDDSRHEIKRMIIKKGRKNSDISGAIYEKNSER
jgi:hypothetical protein